MLDGSRFTSNFFYIFLRWQDEAAEQQTKVKYPPHKHPSKPEGFCVHVCVCGDDQ